MVNASPAQSIDFARVKELAAAGYFQAIALWVNQPLVSQRIYAQVQADERPGCLQILVEFQRSPHKESLIRLLCRRIWQLDSELVEGVNITARYIGQSRILWQRRVRISPRRQPAQSLPVGASSQISATSAAPLMRQRHPANAFNRRSRRRLVHKSRTLVDRQFKLIRAALLTGSAAAAFILGCLTEVVLSGNGLSFPAWQSQATPQVAPEQPLLPSAIPVAFRSTPEPSVDQPAPVVNAALEPVAVMPHDQIPDPADPTVTLVFGGEIALGDLEKASPETADHLLNHLPVYQEADVAMVNLGNSLATAATSLEEEYHHRPRPEAVAALKASGIDLVGLTSEQTMKYGEQGLSETLDTLDQAGIYRVGAGRDQREARRPEILDVKGQRIAYLIYTPDNSQPATADKAGMNVQNKSAIIDDVTALRDQVDWVVVNYRWTGELSTKPNQQQVELAHAAIDAGADLVVGYHPSQLQGSEVYQDRPIVYALSDFIFQDAPLADHDTATLRVSLKPGQMKVEFLPVTVRRALPQLATGEQGEAILQKIRKASTSFKSPLHFPVILKEQDGDASAEMGTPKSSRPDKALGEIEPPIAPAQETEGASASGMLQNREALSDSPTPDWENTVNPAPMEENNVAPASGDGYRNDVNGLNQPGYQGDGPTSDGWSNGGVRQEAYQEDGPTSDGWSNGVRQEAYQEDGPTGDGWSNGVRQEAYQGDGPTGDGWSNGVRQEAYQGDGPTGDGWSNGVRQEAYQGDGPTSDGWSNGASQETYQGDGPTSDGWSNGVRQEAYQGDGPTSDGWSNGGVRQEAYQGDGPTGDGWSNGTSQETYQGDGPTGDGWSNGTSQETYQGDGPTGDGWSNGASQEAYQGDGPTGDGWSNGGTGDSFIDNAAPATPIAPQAGEAPNAETGDDYSLDEWGPKPSSHRDFNTIPSQSGLSPEGDANSSIDSPEAIRPYSEPLVGPLSSSPDGAAKRSATTVTADIASVKVAPLDNQEQSMPTQLVSQADGSP
jgi:poly-gamma-glutamate synthesis protein (capsule biosynthesis protein)